LPNSITQRGSQAVSAGGLIEGILAALMPIARDLLREVVAEVLDEQAASAPPTPALITIDQLAAALQTSRASINRLRERGLPTVMLLDSPRFDLAAVLAWLETRGDERQKGAA
jgi:hypothetical protein